MKREVKEKIKKILLYYAVGSFILLLVGVLASSILNDEIFIICVYPFTITVWGILILLVYLAIKEVRAYDFSKIDKQTVKMLIIVAFLFVVFLLIAKGMGA